MRRSHLVVVGSVFVALITVGVASGRRVSELTVLGFIYAGIAAWATLVSATVDREAQVFPGIVASLGRRTGALVGDEERLTTFRRPRLLVYGHYVTGGVPALVSAWLTVSGLVAGVWSRAAFGAVLTLATGGLLWDHVRRDLHGHIIITTRRVIFNLPGTRAWSMEPGELWTAVAQEATGLVSMLARRFTGKLSTVLLVTTETRPYLAARFGTFSDTEHIIEAITLWSGPPYGHASELDEEPERTPEGVRAYQVLRMPTEEAEAVLLAADTYERQRLLAQLAPDDLYSLLCGLSLPMRVELLDLPGIDHEEAAELLDPGCPSVDH